MAELRRSLTSSACALKRPPPLHHPLREKKADCIMEEEEEEDGSDVSIGDLGSSSDQEGGNHDMLSMVNEVDDEFEPIDHPLEPPDEDQPAECPLLPDHSLTSEECDAEETMMERLPKRLESSVEDGERAAQHSPAQAEPKGHRISTRGSVNVASRWSI